MATSSLNSLNYQPPVDNKKKPIKPMVIAIVITAVVVTITILFGVLGSMAKTLAILKIFSPYSYISVFGIITGESRLYVVGIAAGLLMTVISLVLSCSRYNQIDLILD